MNENGFFEVIDLCHSLDKQHSHQFARRHTAVSPGYGGKGVCMKITHTQDGVVWGKVVTVYVGYDIAYELRTAHDDLDARVRRDIRISQRDVLRSIPFHS